MEKDFIKIPNSIIRNTAISPSSKLVYALLLSNKRVGMSFNTFCISISNVIHMLRYKSGSFSIKEVKGALLELVNYKIILTYDNMSMTIPKDISDIKAGDMFYVAFNEDFINSKEFLSQFNEGDIDEEIVENQLSVFVSIFLSDLIRLFDFDFEGYELDGDKVKVNKGKLFSAYAMILSRANIDLDNIGKGDKVSFEGLEKIGGYSDLSKKTVVKYVKILFDMKLIFKISVSKKNLKKLNVYSRWRDRDLVMLMIDEEKSHIKFNMCKLVKIGDADITDVDSAHIHCLIEKEDRTNINCQWVDDEIIGKYTR